MKYLQRLSLLLVFCAAIVSCKKEYSTENGTGGTTNPTAQWEFKEAGVQFMGPIDSVAIDTISTYTFLTINGRSADGTTQFTLQAFGTTIQPGSYKTPFSLFAYIKGTSPLYQTDQAATDSFTIIITKVDSTGIAGTFSGLAKTGSVSKTIVEGKFSAPLKITVPVTPPAAADSGQVVLWSKAGCGGGTSTNPIDVTVNGKTGQIISFTATEPGTCTPAGSYALKLPVGTYPWVAKCGTDSVTGTVIITKDGCTKQLVDFTKPVTSTDYFPMSPNSFWTSKYDTSAAGPGDTTFTQVTGQNITIAGVNRYEIFSYEDFSVPYKDTLYYRKAGSTYYQYFPATTNILSFDSPQAVVIPFLVDGPVGTSFSSDPYTGDITIPNLGTNSVQQKMDGVVFEKGVSATINGFTFPDVIKVRLSFKATILGQTSEIYRQEQWFAKGVGLVKYMDYYDAPFTTPTYTLNVTRYMVY